VTVRSARIAAIAADRDRFEKQAFQVCIVAAKELIGAEGPIRSGTPIGRLTDSELGWFVGAIIWGWISVRAEQAATEGWNEERAVRSTGLVPSPWLQGAAVSILPALAEACPDAPWSSPLDAWSRSDVAALVAAGFPLIVRAIVARDAAEERLAGKDGAADAASALIAALDKVPPLFVAREGAP
jgi:hypothetical protein